ncbi:MAG: HDIG domain-containing protein [Chloroflexi bacterium]|nr:HDIG domain-containing protein [Chloroflexota bacterium]
MIERVDRRRVRPYNPAKWWVTVDEQARRVGARRRAVRRLPEPWPLVVFGILFSLFLLIVLAFQFLPGRYALREGDVSAYDIKSPVKVSFVSQYRTSLAREQAAAAVPPVYRTIPDAPAQAHGLLASAIDQIRSIRQSTAAPGVKLDQLEHLSGFVLNATVAAQLLALDDSEWERVAAESLSVLDRVMQGRITADQLGDVRSFLPSLVDPSLDSRGRAIVVALASAAIRPTEEVDQAATDAARRRAADAVQPVVVTLEKGETILRNGDVVGPAELEKLVAAGLRNPVLRWRDLLAMLLIAAGLGLFLCLYLQRFQPAVVASPRRMLLLGALLVIATLAAKLTVPGRPYYGYLFPGAAVPMLLAILLDTQLGILGAAVLAVTIGLSTGAGLDLVVAVLVGGGLGAMCVHRMERMNALSVAALVVALGQFGVTTAFQLMNGETDPRVFALGAALALVSGALSAALTLGTVSFLGHICGIATTLNLLELAHPSQPLFRRLLTEAPGTYHHSVVVANLAERAAAAIGADTLLCRIGGYYHDIGKLMRPYAFVENQVDGQNVHDQLDAYTSARVILAHVPDGLALAAKHRIPARVRDLIAQHHGTMLVQYFYHQACKGAEQPVDEAAFRYPGPRPQSREAAIMMLADGVEAAVRACRDRSPASITAIIDKIIQDRVASGQLDDADLTLSDLSKIRQAFWSVLQGMYHPRIEYPAEATRPVALIGGGQG